MKTTTRAAEATGPAAPDVLLSDQLTLREVEATQVSGCLEQ